MTKTFMKREARTIMDIWMPRYHDLYDNGERIALLACYKVDQAAPWIQINFTKAKHLQGQRYCISCEEARKCPVDSNGKIPCYAVAMSKLQYWETEEELHQLAMEVFDV